MVLSLYLLADRDVFESSPTPHDLGALSDGAPRLTARHIQAAANAG